MLFAALCLAVSAPQDPPPRDLAALLRAAPPAAAAALLPILQQASAHRLQILLAEPFQRADGSVGLRRSQLGDPRQYFYPASAIKLPAAIAALLAIQEHNLVHGTAHGLHSGLAIEPRFAGDRRIDREPSNLDGGALTVGHMLRKLFLVSDNAAHNHCVEICGQDGLHRHLWSAGFTSARLWHRLSESRTAAEHQLTRAVRLTSGAATSELPARAAGQPLHNDLWHDLEVGTAYLEGGRRVDRPMSFAEKNAILLRDLQDLLVEVVRPEIDTGKPGFPELSLPHRAFVVQALGELPRESANPRFDPQQVPDHHCKFVLRGARRVVPAPHLRVYDKIGRAYGFSVENAYLEDQRSGRGCFLAVVLYTNPDGVLNDDAYAYDTLADPFLDAVGEVVATAVFGGAAGG